MYLSYLPECDVYSSVAVPVREPSTSNQSTTAATERTKRRDSSAVDTLQRTVNNCMPVASGVIHDKAAADNMICDNTAADNVSHSSATDICDSDSETPTVHSRCRPLGEASDVIALGSSHAALHADAGTSKHQNLTCATYSRLNSP